jgi:hypothetical protein
MTTTVTATFDGKVLVPSEPLDLPRNTVLRLRVDVPDKPATLQSLAELVQSQPASPGPLSDGAAQHDHYLYGAPKRP